MIRRTAGITRGRRDGVGPGLDRLLRRRRGAERRGRARRTAAASEALGLNERDPLVVRAPGATTCSRPRPSLIAAGSPVRGRRVGSQVPSTVLPERVVGPAREHVQASPGRPGPRQVAGGSPSSSSVPSSHALNVGRVAAAHSPPPRDRRELARADRAEVARRRVGLLGVAVHAAREDHDEPAGAQDRHRIARDVAVSASHLPSARRQIAPSVPRAKAWILPSRSRSASGGPASPSGDLRRVLVERAVVAAGERRQLAGRGRTTATGRRRSPTRASTPPGGAS